MRFGSRSKRALCALLLFGCNGVIGEGGDLEPGGISGAAPPRIDRDAGAGAEPSPDPGPAPMPDAGTTPDASVPPPTCDSMTAPPLSVRALRITDVTVNQAVSVPLVDNSTPVNARQAPVVASREGVLRVFVEPQAGWQARDVTARLTLSGAVRDVQARVTDASSATALDSTINFALERLDPPGPARLRERHRGGWTRMVRSPQREPLTSRERRCGLEHVLLLRSPPQR